MTVIDLDDLCGDCPNLGFEICSKCIRTSIHDIMESEHYDVHDYYEKPPGPHMIYDHKWINDGVDQGEK